MQENNTKEIQVSRGFESVKELRRRWKDGTFREILNDWKWIFSYSKRYKKAIGFYLILGLASTCSSQLSAYLNIDIINIITGKQSDRLWFLILISVTSMLVSLFLGNYISRIATRIGININNDIQQDTYNKIMDAEWKSVSEYANGDILNRFNADIKTVSGNAFGWISSVILALVNFLITLVIMWRIDPIVSLIAFASAPFIFLSSRIVLKKQREYGKAVREMSSEMVSFEAETFYNLDTIKSFGIAERYNGKLKWWQKRFKRLQLDYNLFSIGTNVYMSVLGYLVSAACFFYCLYRMWHGAIDYGQMTYILTQRSALSSSFSGIIGVVPTFLSSSVAAHRIKELIDLPREAHIPESGELDHMADKGFSVVMDDVRYAYVQDKTVITDSDFVANPGEIIALVGPSGEGKTTMIRLILGLIRPQEGHVKLRAADGTSVEMNTDTRHLFSYVPQGNTIISGTIADNLRMVKEDASDEEVVEALRMSCAWDFVKDLPDGINTKIGERGKGFSEGQAQRIAIARAILRDCPVLLLDEATSALDVTTERMVLKSIIRQRPNKTIIVTTHRPSVLNMCRRVYRVMETKVTELSEEDSAKMAMDF